MPDRLTEQEATKSNPVTHVSYAWLRTITRLSITRFLCGQNCEAEPVRLATLSLAFRCQGLGKSFSLLFLRPNTSQLRPAIALLRIAGSIIVRVGTERPK